MSGENSRRIFSLHCTESVYLLTARMRSARTTPEQRSACRSAMTTPVLSFSR